MLSIFIDKFQYCDQIIGLVQEFDGNKIKSVSINSTETTVQIPFFIRDDGFKSLAGFTNQQTDLIYNGKKLSNIQPISGQIRAIDGCTSNTDHLAQSKLIVRFVGFFDQEKMISHVGFYLPRDSGGGSDRDLINGEFNSSTNKQSLLRYIGNLNFNNISNYLSSIAPISCRPLISNLGTIVIAAIFGSIAGYGMYLSA